MRYVPRMINNMSDDRLFSGGAYVAPQGGLTLRDRLYRSVRASTESAWLAGKRLAETAKLATASWFAGRRGATPLMTSAVLGASVPTPSRLLYGVFESYENVICK